MKKALLCALLALLLAVSCAVCMPAALAEGDKYSALHEFSLGDGAFRFLIPAGFEQDRHKGRFAVPNERKSIGFYDYHNYYKQPAYYENDEECRALLIPYAKDNAYEFVRVGECTGILIHDSSWVDFGVEATWLYVTNREKIVAIAATAETAEESQAIMDELLAYAVAPEIPLPGEEIPAGENDAQEIVCEEFRVFIPASFSPKYDVASFAYVESGSLTRRNIDPEIDILGCYEGDETAPIDYANAGECVEILSRLADGKPYTVVRVDECAGIVTLTRIPDGYCASLTAINRRHVLRIDVKAETNVEALELMDGILEHIVAPEQPLR